MKAFSNVKKSKLAKETFNYTFINILNKVIPFLLLPILTRILSKQDMGYYMLFQSIYQIFIPILTISLQQSVLINYYHLNQVEFKKYFSGTFYLLLLIFAITSGVTFILSDFIASKADFTAFGIRIIIPIVFFTYITDLRQSLWRNQRKSLLYGKFTVIMTVFQNSIGFLIVFFLKTGWEGMVVGYCIGFGIMSVVAFISFLKEDLIVFSKESISRYYKDSLRISVPIFLHRISSWLGSTVNNILIANKMGSRFTANFGIGSTFFIVCNVLFDALNKAYVPAINERFLDSSEKSAKALRKLTFYYYLIVIIISAGAIIFGYFTIDILFGKAYESTKVLILPTTLAACFNGLYKIHVNKIFFTKKTQFVTLITFSTALINVPLSLYLITNYGLMGAAYALLLVNVLYYVLALIISEYVIKMPQITINQEQAAVSNYMPK